MRDPEGRKRARAGELLAFAERDHTDLRVVELDVRSQEFAEAGQLDVVVHNAGHLALGYTEAFTAEDVADMLDVNAISVQRANRAALPHLRARRSGTLLYVGSTTTVSVPPFLGPYVASKFAFDALAQYGEATEGLFEPGVDAHPVTVAREITRILALPVGEKPFPSRGGWPSGWPVREPSTAHKCLFMCPSTAASRASIA
ncbi:SDR family NAD(P)-dependent oxidoreductase [Streptomyces sp. NPDC003393]